MPGGYWGGLVEGFQGRREAEFKKNYELEAQNRQLADRVFSRLLTSRDPEMQQIALAGLMQPISKKKGFRGFMGEVDSTNPLIQQIVARSNEMVPDEDEPAAPANPTVPEPPAGPPGNAAMSTNQAVRPGAAPINAPPAPLPGGGGMGPQDMNQIPVTAPPLGPEGGPAAGLMPPPPPPEHPMHRRGTGVPTAEEIAGATAQAQLEGRIKAVTAALLAQGAPKDAITDAIMRIVGGGQQQRTLAQVSQWGVKVPGSDIVQPVLLDQTGGGGYRLPDGSPLPPGSQMVRMSGSTGGASLTSKIPDTPEGRQYLIAQGADPAEVSGGSPSGYWKVVTRPDGSVGVQADMYTPPPAFSSTTTIPDTTNPNVAVRAGIPRGGGPPVPLGDEPSQVKSQTQLDAEALLAAVDDEVKLQTSSNLLKKSPTPQQRDALVQRKAREQGLPYQRYDDLVRAAKSSTPITQRERMTGGTMVEKMRARIKKNREDEAAAAAAARAPVRPSMPPTAPAPQAPARARGAGPVGQ